MEGLKNSTCSGRGAQARVGREGEQLLLLVVVVAAEQGGPHERWVSSLFLRNTPSFPTRGDTRGDTWGRPVEGGFRGSSVRQDGCWRAGALRGPKKAGQSGQSGHSGHSRQSAPTCWASRAERRSGAAAGLAGFSGLGPLAASPALIGDSRTRGVGTARAPPSQPRSPSSLSSSCAWQLPGAAALRHRSWGKTLEQAIPAQHPSWSPAPAGKHSSC